MATAVRPVRRTSRTPRVERASQTPGVIFLTRRRGAQILDRQARKYLGMGGDEFVRRYRAGEIEEPDRSEVVRVAMLIPLAER